MLSFVVPVLNEQEGLSQFYKELMKAIRELNEDYEIIFVDDGSVDNSLEILQKFNKENKKVRVFSFRKNLGKSEALTLGFIKSKGDFVITLDADLQDKPKEITKVLSIAKAGTDVVSGWRKDRKDRSKMKIISRVFNGIVSRIFDLSLHDYNCGLKVYTREAAKSLRLYGGLHRFIPLLAFEQGFSVDEVAIEHAPRMFGKSKYGFSKLWKDLPDMFTMLFLVKFKKKPLHFFGIVGGGFAFIGFAALGYLTILRFLGQRIGERPLLFFGMLMVLVGFQIFFTGFLADLMINLSQSQKSGDGAKNYFPIKYSSE